MKNMAIGIFVVILVMSFMQPLLEVSNLLKEKVTLGAAILNSCRAARNNAIASVDYYGSEWNMGDMNAYIDEEEFRRFFAEAFAETLHLDDSVDATVNPMIFRANERWNEITVWVWLDYEDSGDFENRGITRATVEVETPYLFQTSLLQRAAAASSVVYDIREETVFLVQIIN